MDKQYIEKSAFLAAYEKAKRSNKTYTIKGVLDATPTVDAVEVVRCKDCKYSIPSHCGLTAGTHILCRRNGEYWKPDDFCSYGEKSESEAEK